MLVYFNSLRGLKMRTKQPKSISAHDHNLQLVKDTLYEAGYRCTGEAGGSAGDVEFFAGNGPIPVIGLQQYRDGNGLELWIPLSDTIRMDETLAALRKAVTKLSAVSQTSQS